MKNVILIFISCLFCTAINGQITDKGNFLIGGSIGFSTSSSTVEVQGNGGNLKGSGAEALQFNFAPNIGYFFTNNWALGIGLDYTLNRVDEPEDALNPNTNFNTSQDSDLLFGPFTRYYLPVGEDKAFFLETTFGFGSSRNELEINGEDQITANNVLAIGIGPGFTIFSNDAIGIEALAKYNWARSNAEIDFQNIKTETTNITNAIDFSVGLQIYFTRMARSTTAVPGSGSSKGTNPDFY